MSILRRCPRDIVMSVECGTIEQAARSIKHEAWGSSPYYPVDIAIDRPDLDLMKPGMSVRCTVVTGELPDATVVPLAAVSGDAGGRFVISRGERVAVTVLAEGPFDVALEPQPRLAEGTPVETPAFEAGRVVSSAPPAALPDRTDKVVAQGRLDSRAKNSLGPQVPGVWDYTITELAPEGQSVRAGTVVVAFDDRMLRDRQEVTLKRFYQESPQKGGLQIVSALDGQEAIASLGANAVDLAVVDYFLPVMNGGELIRRIRNDKAMGRIPVRCTR